MKPTALAAAAAGALVTLTACSHSAATSAAPASGATATHSAVTHSATQSAAPVNCPRKYDAWMRGPAKKLVATLNAVGSPSTGQDRTAQTAALKKAKLAVASAARNPIPSCADPKGYWTALLMHVNAAAGSANSASGRASITLALKGVPELESELSAELTRTAGVK
jgi:hypothetical protein